MTRLQRLPAFLFGLFCGVLAAAAAFVVAALASGPRWERRWPTR